MKYNQHAAQYHMFLGEFDSVEFHLDEALKFLSNTDFTVYGPHTIKNIYDQKLWNNLVGVETVMDSGLLINMDKFSRYIEPEKINSISRC